MMRGRRWKVVSVTYAAGASRGGRSDLPATSPEAAARVTAAVAAALMNLIFFKGVCEEGKGKEQRVCQGRLRR